MFHYTVTAVYFLYITFLIPSLYLLSYLLFTLLTVFLFLILYYHYNTTRQIPCTCKLTLLGSKGVSDSEIPILKDSLKMTQRESFTIEVRWFKEIQADSFILYSYCIYNCDVSWLTHVIKTFQYAFIGITIFLSIPEKKHKVYCIVY